LDLNPEEKTSGPDVILLSADFISEGEKKGGGKKKQKKKSRKPASQLDQLSVKPREAMERHGEGQATRRAAHSRWLDGDDLRSPPRCPEVLGGA